MADRHKHQFNPRIWPPITVAQMPTSAAGAAVGDLCYATDGRAMVASLTGNVLGTLSLQSPGAGTGVQCSFGKSGKWELVGTSIPVYS